MLSRSHALFLVFHLGNLDSEGVTPIKRISDLAVVVASVFIILFGSEGQVFATSAIRSVSLYPGDRTWPGTNRIEMKTRKSQEKTALMTTWHFEGWKCFGTLSSSVFMTQKCEWNTRQKTWEGGNNSWNISEVFDSSKYFACSTSTDRAERGLYYCFRISKPVSPRFHLYTTSFTHFFTELIIQSIVFTHTLVTSRETMWNEMKRRLPVFQTLYLSMTNRIV